jgi:hypothetical protein
MIRLLRWTLTIFAASAILLAITIAATRTPMTALDMLQTAPDGSRCPNWCILGADPETMTDNEIRRTLSRHPALYALDHEGDRVSYDGFIGERVAVVRIPGIIYVYLDEMNSCRLFIRNCSSDNSYLIALRQELPLGQLIKTVGEPDFLNPLTDIDGTSVVALFYRRWRLVFSYTTTQLGEVGPTDTLREIRMLSAVEFSNYEQGVFAIRWDGFKRY